MNPISYTAQYFGHKLHMDQNEKIGMFRCTHVLAIDGYSGKIVAWKSMPMKNNLIIYDSVYRCIVHTFFTSAIVMCLIFFIMLYCIKKYSECFEKIYLEIYRYNYLTYFYSDMYAKSGVGARLWLI